MKNKIKLLSVKKLKSGSKKYVAEFEITTKNGKKTKRSTKFGAKGMSDFTIHKDTERRNRYIKRHTKDLRTNDPTRAGYLSMYILWNKKTFKSSLADYKRRLNTYNRTGKFPKSIPGSSLKTKFGNYNGSTVIKNVHKYTDFYEIKNNTSNKNIINSFGRVYLYPFLVDKTRFKDLPPEIIEKIEQQLQISDIINQYKTYKEKKEVFKSITAELGEQQTSNPYENIFDWDPSNEKSVQWLEEASVLLTKVDLEKEFWKNAVSDFIIGFEENHNINTRAFLSPDKKKRYAESKKYMVTLLNKLDFSPNVTTNQLFYRRPDILEYFKINNGLNNFGTKYENTYIDLLPPDIINKIEKPRAIEIIQKAYRKKAKNNLLIELKSLWKYDTTKNRENYREKKPWRILDPFEQYTLDWVYKAADILEPSDLKKNSFWYHCIKYILELYLEYDPNNPNKYNQSNPEVQISRLTAENLEIILEKMGININTDDIYWYKKIASKFDINTYSETSFGQNKNKVPDNVKNPKLYLKIKEKIKKDVKAKKRRWGAYDSGRLVREYKQSGGKYSGTKNTKTNRKKSSNLDRWYREKWIDACAWPKLKSCGRTKASIKSKVTYCRPSKIIDSNTPKTVQELTKTEIKKRCKKKSKNPKKIVRK